MQTSFPLRRQGVRRRAVLAAAPALLLAGRARAAGVVRIGYQKYGTLIILKNKGLLEPRLQALGLSVEWREFPAGPQLLEAMNAGALDFGITGETPPIFAQAASRALVYVGHAPPAPAGEAILVPAGSALGGVKELKGRRVALNKGSNVHWLLVRALEANGLGFGDIEPLYLPPADARAAFQTGHVEAWVIWDPYLAAAETALGARRLADATGLVPNMQFYLSTRGFTGAQPAAVRAILDAIAANDAWAAKNTAEVAQLLAPATGLPVPVLQASLGRLTYGVDAMTPDVVAAQQRIADAFHKLGLVPRPVVVQDAVWTPPT